MKVLFSATEASSDLHASFVIKELKKIDPEIQIYGLLGEASRAEGAGLLVHNHELSVMGLTEVIPKIPDVFRILKTLTFWAKTEKPDCAVLIDGPDFNLRLAARLKKNGIPVIYYICPQVWAWRSSRIDQMKKICDRVLSILPFETEFFRKHGGNAEFVGHPLMDEMVFDRISKKDAVLALDLKDVSCDVPWLALLPGSRQSEVRRILPAMKDAVAVLRKSHPKLEIFIPKAPAIPGEFFQGMNVHVVDGKSEIILRSCDVGLITSGTASLQAALCGLPSVVTYKVTWTSSMIYRLFVKYRGPIAMPNIVLGKRLFPEFLQNAATGEALAGSVTEWINNPSKAEGIRRELHELHQKLGGGGASANVARIIGGYRKSVGRHP